MTSSATPSADTSAVATPGLLRRLMALLYDLLVIAGIWVFSTFIITAFNQMESIDAGTWWFRTFLLSAYAGYFVGLWRRNGQTLGMMAWRMVLEREDGSHLRWRDTVKRALLAPLSMAALGLGYVWIWVDRNKRSWHGRLSGTRIRLRPKL